METKLKHGIWRGSFAEIEQVFDALFRRIQNDTFFQENRLSVVCVKKFDYGAPPIVTSI